jgi:hypothetical protein
MDSGRIQLFDAIWDIFEPEADSPISLETLVQEVMDRFSRAESGAFLADGFLAGFLTSIRSSLRECFLVGCWRGCRCGCN